MFEYDPEIDDLCENRPVIMARPLDRSRPKENWVQIRTDADNQLYLELPDQLREADITARGATFIRLAR
ncbi:hypothetical protein [Roseibium aquae]|nr:hypothetical protein [Roseibium aquae]